MKTRSHSEDLISAVEDLANKLLREQCRDFELVTLVDRVMRRTYSDIERGWVRWSYYVTTAFFDGDHKKYEAWAKKNCEKRSYVRETYHFRGDDFQDTVAKLRIALLRVWPESVVVTLQTLHAGIPLRECDLARLLRLYGECVIIKTAETAGTWSPERAGDSFILDFVSGKSWSVFFALLKSSSEDAQSAVKSLFKAYAE